MGKFSDNREKRDKKRAWILGAVIGGAVLLLALALALPALLDPYDCRILPGVSVGGLDLGGMTRLEAGKALKAAAAETLLGKELEVILPEKTLKLSPEEGKLRFSPYGALRAAYRVGRQEEQGEGDLDLTAFMTWDEGYIRGLLSEYALACDTVLTQPKWELEGAAPVLAVDGFDPNAPCQSLLLTMGIPERHLDVEAAYGQVMARYGTAFAGGSYDLTLEVPAETLPEKPDLSAIYAEFSSEAVNDSLDLQTYQLVPGSYGYHFDLAKAQGDVDAADFGQTVAIPMAYVEPEILGEAVYFREELGRCETKHNTNENRNTNLRLVCATLDGMVIQPGEEFSYNGAVGERTAERGYMPAPAYSGNRLVQDYGGGVCQGSTTLYNCILLADMEVLERYCHGAMVSYVPRGLDAAVNWATKTDLRFRNNSHFPVMIRAEVSDGYMKMWLMGTDEKDYYIQMESSSSENDRVVYAACYKCKYDKKTGERISRELEARSTYYKDIG